MRCRSFISIFLLLTLLSVQPLATFAQDQVNALYLPLVASNGDATENVTDASRAAQPPGVQPQPFASNRLARVMTRNLYFGSDLTPLLLVQSYEELLTTAADVYSRAVDTDLPGRMEAIANEIAATQPLVVGLQEAAIWRTGPSNSSPATEVQADFVQMLLAALARRGLSYAAIAVVTGSDAEVPALFGTDIQDVRLTLQDVILARTDLKTADLKLSNLQTGYYSTNLSIPTMMGNIDFPRQWAAVDVKIRGKEFRFVTTHLEAYSPLVRVAQAQELLWLLEQSDLPVILVGDFNSQPSDLTDAAGILSAHDLRDLWQETYPTDLGFTCCQAPDLTNSDSLLDQRIDLILARGGFTVVDIQRIGEDPETDKSASGLWPSDHAGVVATVQLP